MHLLVLLILFAEIQCHADWRGWVLGGGGGTGRSKLNGAAAGSNFKTEDGTTVMYLL